MSKTLALFDFDGTLTTKDSLGDFILFSFGGFKTIIGAVLLSPTLAAYALGLMDNNKAKQKVLNYFFAGMSVEKMRELGERYAKQRNANILRPAGLDKLKWHQQQNHVIVIVSASAEFWLKPWTEQMGVKLIATKLAEKDGFLTGDFDGENCHGEEKVKRIKADYDLSEFKTIYAYGDTSGDKPMLTLADHSFYKPFR